MKGPALIVLSVLAGAFAGAATHVVLSNGEPGPAREGVAPAARPGASTDPELVSDLRNELETLTAKNHMLLERIEALEARPVLEEREPSGGWVTRAELELLLEELRGSDRAPELAASERGELIDLNASKFEDEVADALNKIRREEKLDAVRDYQRKRSERIDEDVEKLRGWLELDDYQVGEMRASLVRQYEREDQQRRLWEEGGDDETLGALKRSDGQTFREELEGFMNPEQFETFWSEVVEGGKGRRESGKD